MGWLDQRMMALSPTQDAALRARLTDAGLNLCTGGRFSSITQYTAAQLQQPGIISRG
jgi:hypothetical protein